MDDKQRISKDFPKFNSFFERWILPITCITAISAFPPLFLYLRNVDEAEFQEILSPLLIFVFVGFVLLGLFSIISRSTYKSAFITSLLMFFILNYALLEKAIQFFSPSLRLWHILPICIFILAHVTLFICKRMTNELANIVTKVLCMVFCGLILFNLAIATPVIINKVSSNNEKNIVDTTEKKTVKSNMSLPNIYFLILDEYSSIDFMKKYYNYDNTLFTTHLQKRGFNVSYTSHNKSITTTTILTNCVNLGYVVTDQTPETEKEAIRVNNLLFKLLGENEYTLTGLGESQFFGLKNKVGKSDHTTKSIGGDTLESIVLKETVAYPFISRAYPEKATRILDSVEYLKSSNVVPNSREFTLFYCLSTHTPFVFKENGDKLNSGFTNWSDKQYYLGSYIYTTKVMTEIIDSILDKDPNSIIVLQSDHSARATMDENLFTNVFKMEDMDNHFNAVYYCGEYIDISGLSGVDTWRLIISKLFNKNFDKVGVSVYESK